MESALTAALPTVEATAGTTAPIVAAYFPEWGIYGRDVQIADVPADQLTHLIYAFARIGPDGRMQLFDSYAATEKRFTESGDAVGGQNGEHGLKYRLTHRLRQPLWANLWTNLKTPVDEEIRCGLTQHI